MRAFQYLNHATYTSFITKELLSSTFPICFFSAIQCELPRNPGNGRAVYASVSYNSLISYECNYGYMLIGDSVRRCEKDKQWTGAEPHCKGGHDLMQ